MFLDHQEELRCDLGPFPVGKCLPKGRTLFASSTTLTLYDEQLSEKLASTPLKSTEGKDRALFARNGTFYVLDSEHLTIILNLETLEHIQWANQAPIGRVVGVAKFNSRYYVATENGLFELIIDSESHSLERLTTHSYSGFMFSDDQTLIAADQSSIHLLGATTNSLNVVKTFAGANVIYMFKNFRNLITITGFDNGAYHVSSLNLQSSQANELCAITVNEQISFYKDDSTLYTINSKGDRIRGYPLETIFRKAMEDHTTSRADIPVEVVNNSTPEGSPRPMMYDRRMSATRMSFSAPGGALPGLNQSRGSTPVPTWTQHANVQAPPSHNNSLQTHIEQITQQWQDYVSSLQAKFNSDMNQLKDHYEKRISLLKAQHEKEMEHYEETYVAKIEDMNNRMMGQTMSIMHQIGSISKKLAGDKNIEIKATINTRDADRSKFTELRKRVEEMLLKSSNLDDLDNKTMAKVQILTTEVAEYLENFAVNEVKDDTDLSWLHSKLEDLNYLSIRYAEQDE